MLSDAVHLLGDAASFLVSICALRVSTTSSTARFTFGLARAEVLGALTSTLITLALTVVLAYEAVVRRECKQLTCVLTYMLFDACMVDDVWWECYFVLCLRLVNDEYKNRSYI